MRVAAGGCGFDASGVAGEGGPIMSRSRVRIGFAALTCSPDTDHSEAPMRPGAFAARCSLALSFLVAMALGFVSSAASADPVPNPAVSGPIEGGVHGYPWNHSLFALRGPGYDYTEQEFFFSGMATDLSTGVQAPYESRMLVRLPRNPADFSGIVTVEWLNVTAQMDLETSWPVEAQYLMGQGIGYVGVSAQLAGVCCGPTTLKGWDPVRYAPLEHPGDRFSYDIFSQAIRALRDPAGNETTDPSASPVDPMRGMAVRWIVANGASQSASFLTTFVNGGYNRGQIDLYVITRGGGPYEDFSTPIFQLNEENNRVRQDDNPRFVAWGGRGRTCSGGVVELHRARAAARPGAARRHRRGVLGEPRRRRLQRPRTQPLGVAVLRDRSAATPGSSCRARQLGEHSPGLQRPGRGRAATRVRPGAGGLQFLAGVPPVRRLPGVERDEDPFAVPDARDLRGEGPGVG